MPIFSLHFTPELKNSGSDLHIHFEHQHREANNPFGLIPSTYFAVHAYIVIALHPLYRRLECSGLMILIDSLLTVNCVMVLAPFVADHLGLTCGMIKLVWLTAEQRLWSFAIAFIIDLTTKN